jgi:hypothetical protein
MTYRFIACQTQKQAEELWQLLIDHQIQAELSSSVIKVSKLSRIHKAVIKKQAAKLQTQVRTYYLPINEEDLQIHVDKIRMQIDLIAQTIRIARQPWHDHLVPQIKRLPKLLRSQLQKELIEALVAPEPLPYYKEENREDR